MRCQTFAHWPIAPLAPTTIWNTIVAAAAISACPAGAGSAMEAIAAKAKMWNSEPAGRSRRNPAATEQAPATRVVAPTTCQDFSSGSSWLIHQCEASNAKAITAKNRAPERSCMRRRFQ